MANDTTLTIAGNLTADPELSYTPNGQAICRFTTASTPRRYNRDTKAWQDSETLFLPCTVWAWLAEHLAASAGKGDRVIVTGRLRTHTWETDQGEKRSRPELTCDEAGVSLRYATARITRTQRRSEQAGGSGEEVEGEPPF